MLFSRKMLAGLCVVLVSGLEVMAFDFNPAVRSAAVTLPAGAGETLKYAARELAEHYELATGTPLPILKDGQKSADGVFEFRLRSAEKETELPIQHAWIECDENCYAITGNDEGISTGTLFAVYDWLDSALGVRWMWPGSAGTYVPECEVIHFREGKYENGPRLKMAEWRDSSDFRELWPTMDGAKSFLADQRVWLKRNRFFNNQAVQRYGHAFTTWWDKYGKEHPEWFQMLPDGTRRPDPTYCRGVGAYITLCVSNQELVRKIVQEWLANPERAVIPRINLNENDSWGRCTCDECLAMDDSDIPPEVRRAACLEKFQKGDEGWVRELGSVTARYMKFALAVLAEADRVAPELHAELTSAIYANYSLAPDMKLSDRICLRYCPPIMFPWTPAKVERYCREWKAWAKTGVCLMMRPNFLLDGHNFPVNYARQFRECFTFAYENNMIGFDFDSLSGQFAAQSFVTYAVARLNCHPELTIEEMEDEFCAGFGAAADEIKAYVERQAEITDGAYRIYREAGLNLRSNAPEDGDYSRFHMAGQYLFTDEIFAELYNRLAAAELKVGDDDDSRQRIDWMRLGLDHARLIAKAQLAYEYYQESGDLVPFGEAMVKLDRFRALHEYDNVSNYGFLRRLERNHWPIAEAKKAYEDSKSR